MAVLIPLQIPQMEKQSISPSLPTPTMPNPFTVHELYDIKQRNYDWQSFKYQLPRKYTHDYNSSVQAGAMFCSKKNYLDDLQKEKKKIPAPNQYDYKVTCMRPQSGKMDRSKRVTMSEEVKEKCQKENIPGPGAYFKRPQSANTNCFSKDKSLFEKRHYLNEVQFLADMNPGVGAYNLNSPKHIAGPKIFKKAHKKTSKKDKENEQNQKFLNTVGSIEGTFEWMKSQYKKKDSNFFSRTKRFHTQAKSQKKPAPNNYKLDTKWTSKTNLAKTLSTNQYKSVYYH